MCECVNSLVRVIFGAFIKTKLREKKAKTLTAVIMDPGGLRPRDAHGAAAACRVLPHHILPRAGDLGTRGNLVHIFFLNKIKKHLRTSCHLWDKFSGKHGFSKQTYYLNVRT